MCFIIPTSIHRNILERGNKDQRDIAVHTLRTIHNFAGDRVATLRKMIMSANPFENEEERREVKERTVYDAGHKMSLPGKLVRKEGSELSGDRSVDLAYDGSGSTWDLFNKFFGRNSIDNKGMEIKSTVHFGKNFANAFWNGDQMTYGCGDGTIFKSFVGVIDVVGHEITHGVTQYSSGLVYRNQPGALNEHMSDVFGSLVKQYVNGHTAEKADWLIGEGLFCDGIQARALRDMKNPGTAYDDPTIGRDRQPNHMDRILTGSEDNGHVHGNSGICNRAFANAAIIVGGFAWEKVGQVWYKTLTEELKPTSQFQDCANATVKVSTKLYGKSSKETKAIKEGWKMVGITVK